MRIPAVRSITRGVRVSILSPMSSGSYCTNKDKRRYFTNVINAVESSTQYWT